MNEEEYFWLMTLGTRTTPENTSVSSSCKGTLDVQGILIVFVVNMLDVTLFHYGNSPPMHTLLFCVAVSYQNTLIA